MKKAHENFNEAGVVKMRALTRIERRALRAFARLDPDHPDYPGRERVGETAQFIVLNLLHPTVRAAYDRLGEKPKS